MALNAVKTDYVLIILDDYWLKAPVNFDKLYRAVKIMDDDEDVNSITFCVQPKSHKVYNDEYVIRGRLAPYRINTQIGIWRKKYILSLLLDNESAWEYEINASVRSIFTKGKLLSAINNSSLVFDYDWGLLVGRGKYRKNIVDYFKNKENLNVDTDLRGIFSDDGTRNNCLLRIMRIIKYVYKSLVSVIRWKFTR